MRCVRAHSHGDSSVLQLEDVAVPTLSTGQVLVKVAAAGLNFVDIYLRSGLYKPPTMPFTLGKEGAGVIEAVAKDVNENPEMRHLQKGSRVCFAASNGSYAEFAVVDANKCIPVDRDVPLEDAAAVCLQGLTAHYLTTSTYMVGRSDTVLVHAGAGGTGRLIIQIAKMKGARVITTVSTLEKAELARQAGADEVILYNDTNFADETRRLTDNLGVNVVYDSVGASTWEGSLASLKPLGHLILFGNASGPVPPIDPLRLCTAGSITLVRPTLKDYVPTYAVLQKRATELFSWMRKGMVRVRIGGKYELPRAAEAQDMLTSRMTTGKILIIP